MRLSASAGPAAAREVDPELPAHWSDLLPVLGHHDDADGPRAVLKIVRRELRVIAEHRDAARGELRTSLMRVERVGRRSRHGLANDTGDVVAAKLCWSLARRVA
jgi:hypothetical protein